MIVLRFGKYNLAANQECWKILSTSTLESLSSSDLDPTLIDAEKALTCLWCGEWWLVPGAMQWCYPCTDCNSNWEEGEAILAFKARFIKFSAHRNPINSKYGPCLLLQNTKQSLQLWIEISLKGRISRSRGGDLSIEHWISLMNCPRSD